jgi:hypothetical protein
MEVMMGTLIKAECPACDTEFVVVEDSTEDIDDLNCPVCLTDVELNEEEDDDDDDDDEE